MADDAELARRFRSPAAAQRFAAAYAELAGRWPQPLTALDVGGEFGATHVLACGPAGGSPVVLLPGHGATAAVWFATAQALGGTHRVYAIDPVGDAGLSVAAGRAARRPGDLTDWLDGVLGQLGLDATALCGHSYGGWLALRYALDRPERVTRLALLDPTDCFAPMSLAYRLRAVPLLLRPAEGRARALVGWETGGRADPGGSALDSASLDRAALTVHALSAEFRSARIVLPKRPPAAELAGLHPPVLVLLAGRSRSHDAAAVGGRARELLPSARVVTLAGASHHSVPANDHAELNRELAAFLG
jgi:pimeloyl-ACP methyl ester carboxylesterase